MNIDEINEKKEKVQHILRAIKEITHEIVGLTLEIGTLVAVIKMVLDSLN